MTTTVINHQTLHPFSDYMVRNHMFMLLYNTSDLTMDSVGLLPTKLQNLRQGKSENHRMTSIDTDYITAPLSLIT